MNLYRKPKTFKLPFSLSIALVYTAIFLVLVLDTSIDMSLRPQRADETPEQAQRRQLNTERQRSSRQRRRADQAGATELDAANAQYVRGSLYIGSSPPGLGETGSMQTSAHKEQMKYRRKGESRPDHQCVLTCRDNRLGARNDHDREQRANETNQDR